jgi:ribonuclease BN (tRNA processing enzyme)
MSVRIIPLGTRGWMPLEGRQTMCFLVQVDDNDFLFDCGTGVARFALPKIKQLLRKGPLNIIFSHFHLDHIVGLTYLSGLFEPEKKIRLIGPSKDLVEYGLTYACRHLGSPPIFGTPFEKWPLAIEVIEFGDSRLQAGGIEFMVMNQKHKGGAISLRLADELCYVTDAEPSRDTVSFAQGVRYLLHEAYEIVEGQYGTYHSHLEDAIDTAKDAQVTNLVPIHFGPNVRERDILSISKRQRDDVHLLVPIEGSPLA